MQESGLKPGQQLIVFDVGSTDSSLAISMFGVASRFESGPTIRTESHGGVFREIGSAGSAVGERVGGSIHFILATSIDVSIIRIVGRNWFSIRVVSGMRIRVIGGGFENRCIVC